MKESQLNSLFLQNAFELLEQKKQTPSWEKIIKIEKWALNNTPKQIICEVYKDLLGQERGDYSYEEYSSYQDEEVVKTFINVLPTAIRRNRTIWMQVINGNCRNYLLSLNLEKLNKSLKGISFILKDMECIRDLYNEEYTLDENEKYLLTTGEIYEIFLTTEKTYEIVLNYYRRK